MSGTLIDRGDCLSSTRVWWSICVLCEWPFLRDVIYEPILIAGDRILSRNLDGRSVFCDLHMLTNTSEHLNFKFISALASFRIPEDISNNFGY